MTDDDQDRHAQAIGEFCVALAIAAVVLLFIARCIGT